MIAGDAFSGEEHAGHFAGAEGSRGDAGGLGFVKVHEFWAAGRFAKFERPTGERYFVVKTSAFAEFLTGEDVIALPAGGLADTELVRHEDSVTAGKELVMGDEVLPDRTSQLMRALLQKGHVRFTSTRLTIQSDTC